MTAALPLFIRSADVAALLGLTDARAFLAQRDRLEDELLFPPAVPVQRKVLRWRRDEVLAWINRQGVALLPAPPRGNVVQLRVM